MQTRGKCAETYLGFTLIELLIVVAIIGILAAIAVPNFLNAQLRAKVAKAYSDIKAISMAEEMYYLDNNSYTVESEDNIFSGTRARRESGLLFLTSPIAYIATVPIDHFELASKQLTSNYPRAYELGVITPVKSKKIVAYLLFTVGPDGSENGLWSENPFVGIQRNGGQGNTYASSNGMKSNGDIYWYGGDSSLVRNLVVDGITYNGSFPPNFRN